MKLMDKQIYQLLIFLVDHCCIASKFFDIVYIYARATTTWLLENPEILKTLVTQYTGHTIGSKWTLEKTERQSRMNNPDKLTTLEIHHSWRRLKIQNTTLRHRWYKYPIVEDPQGLVCPTNSGRPSRLSVSYKFICREIISLGHRQICTM
jgi:hypothetical protein